MKVIYSVACTGPCYTLLKIDIDIDIYIGKRKICIIATNFLKIYFYGLVTCSPAYLSVI